MKNAVYDVVTRHLNGDIATSEEVDYVSAALGVLLILVLGGDRDEAGFAGAFARAGYRTGYIGKAHFATSHTFKPTGTPECRNSDQDPDWYGPYMGFEHVELVVEGHNHWPPMKPPLV